MWFAVAYSWVRHGCVGARLVSLTVPKSGTAASWAPVVCQLGFKTPFAALQPGAMSSAMLLLCVVLCVQVSCMPGGTASNIVAYIARGDMVRDEGGQWDSTQLSRLCSQSMQPAGGVLAGVQPPVRGRAVHLLQGQYAFQPNRKSCGSKAVTWS